MEIEEFFFKSVGEWNSMRSGHSLAFKEFEEIRSKIRITPAQSNDSRVINLLSDNKFSNIKVKQAFLINWEAKSEWKDKYQEEKLSGESILIPIEVSKKKGKIIFLQKKGYGLSLII